MGQTTQTNQVTQPAFSQKPTNIKILQWFYLFFAILVGILLTQIDNFPLPNSLPILKDLLILSGILLIASYLTIFVYLVLYRKYSAPIADIVNAIVLVVIITANLAETLIVRQKLG